MLHLDSYEARLRWTQGILWPALTAVLALVRWSLPCMRLGGSILQSILHATRCLRAVVRSLVQLWCLRTTALGRSCWAQYLLLTLAALTLSRAVLEIQGVPVRIQIEVCGRPWQLLRSELPAVPRTWTQLLPRHLQLLTAPQQRLALHVLPLGHRALEFSGILPTIQQLAALLVLIHLHLRSRLAFALSRSCTGQPALSHKNSRPVMAPFRSTSVHPHRAGMRKCMIELTSKSQE